MTSDVLVRKADPDDITGVQQVARKAWHESYDDIFEANIVDSIVDDRYEEEVINLGVENESQDFFVAERDEQLVGYAHVGPHPPRRVHQLYRLYIDPDEGQDGTRRQLLAEIEQALYDRDIDWYETEVLAENETAVLFYESVGFKRVDEIEREFGDGLFLQYIFRKPL